MNNDEMTQLLSMILMILIVILVVLFVLYLVLSKKIKDSEKIEEKEKIKTTNKKVVAEKEKQIYNKQSIYSFMDFDQIQDNMIVRKNGRRFLMVIECQGVNYDLMSGLEKNGVEQGFVQFLNTLRYPIQLYIQTRTVNLEAGIVRYKTKLNEIRDRLSKKQLELHRKQEMGYSEEEIKQAKLEVVRERNLYEYGQDIVSNTERMSLNKNILRKHYYVIIEYMPEDITNLSSEEIRNMAFSELYTKAQTIISSLSVCGVNGKVLDSIGLAELLYVAYNRDEAEVYELNKALRAGYDELYTTAPNVLVKRMKELDKRIEQEAIQLANNVVMEVIGEEQAAEEARKVKEKEDEMDELIAQMARMILQENIPYVGKDVVEKADEKVTKRTKAKKKAKEKEVKK